MPAWLRDEGDALVLSLHVQPGAAHTSVDGAHGDSLKLKLAAAPVEGRANAELLRWLARAFGVPRRNVLLLRGETARAKVVRIVAPSLRPDRT
ncbi:MAG: YggU family protein, partial [Betaproteobacteria bacterium]|nr:YggU family protein [Betaproteobacteria bacterium]